MKGSMKQFYEYYISDEELMMYTRLTAEWNEKSFIKMKQLTEAVMKAYRNEDYYPKRFVYYFMLNIPSVINIISHFRACSEGALLQGYTNESYLRMISERIEQLEELRRKFGESLTDKESRQVMGKMPELKTGNEKDSIKRFYEYTGPDGELKDYFCITAEWNGKSFVKMKELAEAVMRDYEEKDYYPKRFVLYFVGGRPSAVYRHNQFKVFSEEESLTSYTNESYLSMTAERIKQLDELYGDFIHSLWDKESRQITKGIEMKRKCSAPTQVRVGHKLPAEEGYK